MRGSKCGTRVLMIVLWLATTILAGIAGAPSASATKDYPCLDARFTSHPKPGKEVRPGETIVYKVEMLAPSDN